MTIIRRGLEGYLAGTRPIDLVVIPGIDGDGFPTHRHGRQHINRLSNNRPLPRSNRRYLIFWSANHDNNWQP